MNFRKLSNRSLFIMKIIVSSPYSNAMRISGVLNNLFPHFPYFPCGDDGELGAKIHLLLVYILNMDCFLAVSPYQLF